MVSGELANGDLVWVWLDEQHLREEEITIGTPVYTSDRDAVKAQAARIRELISECEALRKENARFKSALQIR